MKLLIVLMTFIASASFAQQMPNADALKAKANSAVDAGAQQAQKADDTRSQTLQETKTTTVQKVEQKALVNLNTASAADLAKLPGIGPARAQAIIAARPYNSISDLKKVKGIKEGVIEKIKGLVTVK